MAFSSDNDELIFYNLAWDAKKENFSELILTRGVEEFAETYQIPVQPLLMQLRNAHREDIGDNIAVFTVPGYSFSVDMVTGFVLKIRRAKRR